MSYRSKSLQGVFHELMIIPFWQTDKVDFCQQAHVVLYCGGDIKLVL